MKVSQLSRQFKQYCLLERGMTPKSHTAIISTLEKLVEFAETERIKQLSNGIIREFLFENTKSKGWSPKTFRNYLQNLSSFFSWCEKQGFISKNPTKNIEKPKIPKRLPRCITKEETMKILYHTAWYPWHYKIEKIRNEAILTMFIFSGLRLRELLNLKTNDVNLESEQIIIRQGKGKKDRLVPIHPRLSVVLRGYMKEKQKNGNIGQWFFTSVRSEKRLTEKNLYNIFKKISLASGIKITPHMLRHTFARLSVNADLNLYKLKEIMGHSCISTTQIYLSVSNESIKKSFNELQLI